MQFRQRIYIFCGPMLENETLRAHLYFLWTSLGKLLEFFVSCETDNSSPLTSYNRMWSGFRHEWSQKRNTSAGPQHMPVQVPFSLKRYIFRAHLAITEPAKVSAESIWTTLRFIKVYVYSCKMKSQKERPGNGTEQKLFYLSYSFCRQSGITKHGTQSNRQNRTETLERVHAKLLSVFLFPTCSLRRLDSRFSDQE